MKHLKREAKVWAEVKHPNILPLYGIKSGDQPRLISRWCEDGDLMHYLNNHPDLPLTTRIQLVRASFRFVSLRKLNSSCVLPTAYQDRVRRQLPPCSRPNSHSRRSQTIERPNGAWRTPRLRFWHGSRIADQPDGLHDLPDGSRYGCISCPGGRFHFGCYKCQRRLRLRVCRPRGTSYLMIRGVLHIAN